MAFIAAAIVAVVAAGLQTYMAVRASEQQAEQFKAVQKQKELEASAAQDAATFEEKQARRRNALLIGQQRAIFSAAGVETESGTPFLQEVDFLKQSELEALNIRAFGGAAASERSFEGRIAGYRARVARAGIPLQIASGVVSAAGSALSIYGYSGGGGGGRPSGGTGSDWL